MLVFGTPAEIWMICISIGALLMVFIVFMIKPPWMKYTEKRFEEAIKQFSETISDMYPKLKTDAMEFYTKERENITYRIGEEVSNSLKEVSDDFAAAFGEALPEISNTISQSIAQGVEGSLGDFMQSIKMTLLSGKGVNARQAKAAHAKGMEALISQAMPVLGSTGIAKDLAKNPDMASALMSFLPNLTGGGGGGPPRGGNGSSGGGLW